MKNLRTLTTVKLGITLLVALLTTPVQADNDDMDPLNPAELAKATSLVQSSTPTATQRTLIAPASTTTPPREPELLLVERHINEKNQTGRLADVYKYDYTSNETIISVIDLDTNQVISTQRQQHLQLPLTENELKRASDLIFADDEEHKLLTSEYKRITGQTLNGPEQLQVKAFVFLADSLPEQLNAASKQCGLHRCAQVLLYTHDSVVFEVSPIVNLSAGVITQNIGF